MLVNRYKDKFDLVYKNLNPAQKKAVDLIEGPVMVVAGPGTGKTQILAARIANILLKTDVLPENILCLTYTDAGTVAMRNRLNEFIGPASYRVNIFTFHSFCNMVIQDNLEIFGFRNLDPASEIEKIQYTRSIIDSLDISNPLRRTSGEIYFEVYRLLHLYRLVKQEDLTPEFIIGKVNEYLASLPLKVEYQYKKNGKNKDGTTYKKGDVNEKLIEPEKKRMMLLTEACKTFNTYEQRLNNNKQYDFEDMILWVIKAFKKNSDLLASYQEQFQYILVDEFQDTSGSQNELLNLLIQYWDEPNVFVVGDDDQSIFRFQGANIENIELFKNKYINGQHQLITLTENYRSSQLILDSAQAIIKNSLPQNRLSADKLLLASGNNSHNTIKPAVIVCRNEAEEAVYIASRIKELLLHGVEPKNIAVLYREHKQTDDLITYLRNISIDVNAKKRVDILTQPLIKKIICILNFIDSELTQSNSGEVFIFELLHFPEFGLPPIEIAKLATAISNKNYEKRQTSWREELRLQKTINKPNLFNSKSFTANFENVSNIIENLISDASGLTLQQLIFEIINRCGLLVWGLKKDDSQWSLTLVNTFFNFVKQKTIKNFAYGIKDLLHDINLHQSSGVQIQAEQIFSSSNGVNFITAHASKGLEFTYVFLTGCTAKSWDKNKPSRGYKLPDNITTTSSAEVDEVRRLFYVALTRAEIVAEITYAQKTTEGKDLEPTMFISELQESNTVITKYIEVNPKDTEDFYTTVYTKNEAVMPAAILQSEYINVLLDKYSISVTHLNNYLKCPLKFFYNNLIRVPAPKNASMTFGSAVHYSLERLFKKMMESADKSFAGVNDVIKDFIWHMHRHRDSFTDAEFDLKIAYGKEFIPKYYNYYVNAWNKITAIEKPFRNIDMEGVPISGKLDKIEFEGNYVNVVDYKTGQYAKAKDKFKAPNPDLAEKPIPDDKEQKFEELYGGDYWRQAIFYKLLIDYDKTKDWIMRSSEFDFVEPDKNNQTFHKEKIIIDNASVEIVKHQIIQTYKNIKEKKFDKGCGKDDCDWCNFTKNYYSDIAVGFPLNNDEGLENVAEI